MGTFLLAGLLVAVVAVLLSGVVLMGIGGKANAKYGNKLMVARVTIQGIILLLLMLLFTGVKH